MKPYLLKEAQEKLNNARVKNDRLQHENDNMLRGKSWQLIGTMIAAGIGYVLPLHIAIKSVIWVVLVGHAAGVAQLLIHAWRMHALSRKIENLQTEINRK